MKKVHSNCRARRLAAITWIVLALGGFVLATTGCNKASAPNGEVTLAEMNQAMRMMSLSPVGAPRTVDELTNFPAFKGRPLPSPPAGKKFIINPATGQVVVGDQ